MQKTTGKSEKEISVVTKRTDTEGSIENERILLESIVGIRKELHITQKELAYLSNNTQQEISRLEQKKHSPSVRTLCRILDSIDYELQLSKKEKNTAK